MSGTGVALAIGSYAAGQALLIVAITVVPVCLTVITLVVLVEPRDRVQAIRELAPALLFTKFRRRRADDDAGPTCPLMITNPLLYSRTHERH